MTADTPPTRRTVLRLAATTTAAGLAGCLSSIDPTEQAAQTASTAAAAQTAEVETVASNLEVPWGAEFAPDGTLYFTERPGRLHRLRGGSVERLATLEDTAVVGEGGLLGLALHPSFPNPPVLFLYQTYERGGDVRNRILRYRLSNGEARREGTLFDGIPGASIHDGGRLAFGPDGALYATCGDATDSNGAQDPSTLNGSVLRLNPDGTIPPDNPFDDAVFTYGHRNPQGLAFHPETDELYSTEHGPDTDDEINLLEAGNNYGWPDVTGPSDDPAFTNPLAAYTPTIAPGSAAFFEGAFYFGTLVGTHLHRVTFGADGRSVKRQERLFQDEFGRLRTVLAGADGLYVTTSNRDGRGQPAAEDDRILRWNPGTATTGANSRS